MEIITILGCRKSDERADTKERIKMKTLELLEEASKLKDDWRYSQFVKDSAWGDDLWELYLFNPICGMYVERNPLLEEYLGEPVDIRILKELLITDIRQAAEIIREETNKAREERVSRIANTDSLEEVAKEINSQNQLLLQIVADEPIERQLRFYQLSREWELYERERKIYKPLSPEVSNYIEQNTTVEREGKRYGLITLDNSHKLKIMLPPRVFDSKNKKTIFLDSFITETLADEIQRLYDKKMVGRVSLRGDRVFCGECQEEYLMEEMEFGEQFVLDFDKIEVLTKLYLPYSYEDQLWVRRDNSNLYFEEMDSRLILTGDIYVTRLLHVRIQEENVKSIEHIDWELLFYTKDEFEGRKKNSSQKGTARERRKIFKLDNCSIPFDEMTMMFDADRKEIKVPFLFYLLNQCMKHKELLREYFEDTMSSEGI